MTYCTTPVRGLHLGLPLTFEASVLHGCAIWMGRAFWWLGLISRGLVVGEFCMRGFGIQGLLDSTSVRTA